MTELSERMKLHTEGQITWPEPMLAKTCDACRHFSTATFKTAGKGRCVLVAGHQGIKGKGFEGAIAIACPKFSMKEIQ